MLRLLKRAKKYLFKNRYIRCFRSAKKIIEEANGKKVLITDNTKDDLIICNFLKWKKIEFVCYRFEDTIKGIERGLVWEEYYIWVTMCPELRRKISNLVDCGIELTNIHYIYYAVPDLDINRPQDVYDVNLGFTRQDEMGGFTVFSRDNYRDADRIIVILGNSTSDATFAYCRSWGEFLYEKLIANGENVAVLCGGMIRINSSQELLKLIRDVIPQEPDIVINVSGVCNIDINYKDQLLEDHPYIWNYQKDLFENKIKNKKIYINRKNKVRVKSINYGLENKKSYAKWWVDDMRMMHAVCVEFNIKYWAILQPNMYMGNYKLTGTEHTSKDKEYPQRIRAWYKEVKGLIKNEEYILDFTNLYDGYKNIYWDTCHVYENGNRIMAEAIYNLIKNIL